MAKLTEEELKNVQGLNQEFLNVKVKIADAVINLFKAVPMIDQVQQKFGEVEKELIEVYGKNAVIDLATGEVKDPEEEPVEENKTDGENK